MRKITGVFFIALLTAGTLCAQELTFSGELKTGFYISQEQIGSLDPKAAGGMTNTDGDSGGGEGRARIDLQYTYGNIGMRMRFQVEPVANYLGPFYPTWSSAYAFGNLFNDQLTISAGILGDTPWGSGGPELRSDLVSREYTEMNSVSKEVYTKIEGLMGVRVEYKPSFLPGLNVGFVLNQPDETTDDIKNRTFGDVLGESVIGAAYEHDLFAVRVGYRFDSKSDMYKEIGVDPGKDPIANEGGRLTYRLEEHILETKAEGMKVWINGCYYGIGSDKQEVLQSVNGVTTKFIYGIGEYSINWLYWLWDTDSYIAKFDTCFAFYKQYKNSRFKPIGQREEYKSLEFKPAFYYKLFDNLLQAGVGLGFGMEFGDGKTYIDSPYQYISVEPQIKLNIGSTAYLAFVYNFTDKYSWWENYEGITRAMDELKSQKHSINIRAVYTF